MENFEIKSNLEISGTKLIIDGKEVNKKDKVVGISFYASSPVKDSNYSSGWVDLSVTVVDENDNVVTNTYRKSTYESAKVPMGKVIKDFLEEKGIDEVVQFIGREVPKEKQELIDKIIAECKSKNINCPEANVLATRTLDSLRDKCNDLGIDKNTEKEETK